MKPAVCDSSCRKFVSLLASLLGVGEETAYTMMLFTAALTDLSPDDEEVFRILLRNSAVLQEDA